MRILRLFPALAALLLLPALTIAQNGAPTPQTVRIEAADGLTLVGDFYALIIDGLPAEGAPAVLLIHQYRTSRGEWDSLIAPLAENGYHVLTIDLRGHGDTGGAEDWHAALADVQTWLDWLREQPNVRANGISIIGSSIGAIMALAGCGADDACVTAIALSPTLVGCDSRDCSEEDSVFGVDIVRFLGEQQEIAVSQQLSQRSALLIASQGDSVSIDTLKTLVADSSGEVGARIFAGQTHGIEFIDRRNRDATIPLMIDWLNEHTG
jgi:pimeloyl-ACP methyl ester carboxylesterase